MALKNIKATELNTTESKFRRSVLQSGIGKVSAELKSSLDKNHQSGLLAEYNVKKLLEAKGWVLILHRFKTRAGEIDLVFEKEEKILLIEVKKLTHSWRSFQRVSQKQQLTLKANNLLFLLNFKEKKTESYVAWVNQKNVITFCSVD